MTDSANNPTPFSVLYWGSHPDQDNDDCWTGEDYATEAEARTQFAAKPEFTHTRTHTIAFIELDGPGVHEIRPNPEFDAARNAREDAAHDRAWRQEIATEAGMLGGCDAYNEVMGY